MGVAPGESGQSVSFGERPRHCVGPTVFPFGAAVPDLDTVDIRRGAFGAFGAFRMLKRVREYGDAALTANLRDGLGKRPRRDWLRHEPP